MQEMNSEEPAPWARISTPRRTMIRSICRRRFSRTRISSGPSGVLVAGWQSGALHHFPGRRSRDARRHRPHRPDPQAAKEAIKGTPLQGAKISIAGIAATFKDFRRAPYTISDRRSRRAQSDFDHHDDHHPEPDCRRGHRGDGGAFLGLLFGLSVLVWQDMLGIELYWMVLADVGDRALGGRIGLQPVAGVPTQRRNRRRAEYRNHPCHGRHRRGGDGRRHGVRRHHVLVGIQRFADHRSDRYDHRPGLAVRHADRALVHDAVDCRVARTLVLVAETSTPPAGQQMLRPYGSRPAVRELLGEESDEQDASTAPLPRSQ